MFPWKIDYDYSSGHNKYLIFGYSGNFNRSSRQGLELREFILEDSSQNKWLYIQIEIINYIINASICKLLIWKYTSIYECNN